MFFKDYDINFFLRQEWTDPRLALEPGGNEEHNITLYYELFSDIWVPDIFIANEKTNGEFHDITVPNILLQVSPSGKILLSRRQVPI